MVDFQNKKYVKKNLFGVGFLMGTYAIVHVIHYLHVGSCEHSQPNKNVHHNSIAGNKHHSTPTKNQNTNHGQTAVQYQLFDDDGIG
jgi:hypothetical protein